MKTIGVIMLTVLLLGSLSACGRKDKETTPTTNTETTSTFPTIVDPTIMDPTLETNIPDPNVNSTMPEMTIETQTGTTAREQ